MKTVKFACLLVGLALLIPTHGAFALSATEIEQKATHITKVWWDQVSRLNKEIADAKTELDALSKRTPRPSDYDKQQKDIRARIVRKQESINYATATANNDLGLLQHTDTPSIIARIKDAVENGIPVKCVKGSVAPGEAAKPPTTGAQIPDPTKTALVVLKFSVTNCQSK